MDCEIYFIMEYFKNEMREMDYYVPQVMLGQLTWPENIRKVLFI